MNNSGNKKSPKLERVNSDEPMYTVFMWMLQMEVGGIFACNHNEMYEWYYNHEKLNRHDTSSYSNSNNRDSVAFSRTETFRKTISNGPPFTTKFLNSILNKFRTFGNFETWEDFIEKYADDYYNFSKSYYGTYNTVVNKSGHNSESLSFHEAMSFLYSHAVYRDLVECGQALGFNNKYKLVALAGYRREIRFSQEDDLSLMEVYEKATVNHKKMFTFDRKKLYKDVGRCMFIGGDGHGIIDSITLIPLNKKGNKQILECGTFLKHPLIRPAGYEKSLSYLPYSMIATRETINEVEGIILEFGTNNLADAILVEFTTYIELLVRNCLGEHYRENLPVYVANDSDQKREFINLYNLVRVSDKCYSIKKHYANYKDDDKQGLENIEYYAFFGIMLSELISPKEYV